MRDSSRKWLDFAVESTHEQMEMRVAEATGLTVYRNDGRQQQPNTDPWNTAALSTCSVR